MNTDNKHMGHMAPVEHLVKVVLHKGRTTAELVRGLRYRRRRKRPKQQYACEKDVTEVSEDRSEPCGVEVAKEDE